MHGDFSTGDNHHQIGRHVHIEPLVQIGGDGFAQGQNTGGGRIAVMAVAQRLDRSFHNMLRGLEVRLADTKIDDVLALALQFGGAGQNRKGVFFTHTTERINDVQHKQTSHCLNA